MVEYKFNKLDDDFITLWSNYLLNGDRNLIMKDLETLAELGQINAVQSWYLFNDVGVNPVIDEIVKSYKGNNYNELFAIARFMARDKEMLKKQRELLQYVDEDSGSTYHCELTERAKNCRAQIYDLPFIICYKDAIDEAHAVGKRICDPIVLETSNEIMLELSKKILIKDDKNWYYGKVLKNSKKIYSMLLDRFEDKNIVLKVEDEPVLGFALAKSILTHDEKYDKKKRLAVSILMKLSERSYSEKMVKYKKNKRV